MLENRGQLTRRLVGLTLQGETPPPRATTLVSDAKTVGEITSAVQDPADLRQSLALGYVKRKLATPGTTLLAGDARAHVRFVVGESDRT
jgi:aminomethyltransferase